MLIVCNQLNKFLECNFQFLSMVITPDILGNFKREGQLGIKLSLALE